MSAEIQHYDIAGGRDGNVAGYTLAVLEEIAAGVPRTNEAAADYAQRHLREMVELGHITPWATS